MLMSVFVNAFVCVCMCINVCSCVYVYVSVGECVLIFVCVCVCVCVDFFIFGTVSILPGDDSGVGTWLRSND